MHEVNTELASQPLIGGGGGGGGYGSEGDTNILFKAHLNFWKMMWVQVEDCETCSGWMHSKCIQPDHPYYIADADFYCHVCVLKILIASYVLKVCLKVFVAVNVV